VKPDDFSPVTELMEEVGRQIVAWRTDAASRHLHSEKDFKTEADRRAHDLICDGLTRLYPGVEIISEESSVHDSVRPDRYWLIDPIDGTASWYHGFDGFVTQAAYIEGGVPLFGIVHAPVLVKTWSAVKNNGSYLNRQPLPALEPGGRLVAVDNTPEPHGIARDVMRLLDATGYLESGSLGLKSVLVADGTADLFVKDVCVRDWDIAPAAVILGEVMGCLSLPDGAPFEFCGSFEKTAGFIAARDPDLLKRAVQAFSDCKKSGTSRAEDTNVKLVP
jgi:3'(2'), 5'-bisphosphate nucleotidase